LLFSGAVPGWTRPDALFACAGDPVRSRCDEQTLTPLSRLTGLPLDCSVHDGEEPLLLRRVMAVSETALICWRHASMNRLARLVVGERHGLPLAWPAPRHDLVWRMVRGVGGVWRFEQRFQRVLAGDTRDPARLNGVARRCRPRSWIQETLSMTSSTSRVAIITGGGTGVGRAAAKALLAAGWRVVLAGRRPEPLQQAIELLGARADQDWASPPTWVNLPPSRRCLRRRSRPSAASTCSSTTPARVRRPCPWRT
jgi:hypothetical protein